MKKVTFLFTTLILFIGMFFIVQSCQKEIDEKQPPDSKYQISRKSLHEIEGIKSLDKPLEILKPWLENFRNKSRSSGLSFAIDPDNIIETLSDSTSTYSFKILTPTDPQSLYETFVVDNSDPQNIRYHIYKYQIKQDENQYAYLNLNRLDISEFHVEIGDFNKDINKIMAPSLDEFEDGCYELIWVVSPRDMSGEPEPYWDQIDCNTIAGGGDSSDNAETTFDDTTGFNDVTETIYIDGDIDSSGQSNVGGSGGSGTSGESFDDTTANPFSFNADISPIMLSKIVTLSNTMSEIDPNIWIENDIEIWATKVAENLTITEVVQLQNFLTENKTNEGLAFAQEALVALENKGEVDLPNKIIIDSTLIKNQRLNCVYNKFKNGTNTVASYLTKFLGEKPVANLSFYTDDNFQENYTDDYWNAGAVTTQPNNYMINITFNTDSDLDSSAENFPTIILALELIHEMVHAEMYRKILSYAQQPEIPWSVELIESMINDFPGISDYYTRYWLELPPDQEPTDPQHQLMAEHYILNIVEALRDFDDNQHSTVFYTSLAWIGLKDTVAWNNLSPDVQSTINTNIQNALQNETFDCN